MVEAEAVEPPAYEQYTSDGNLQNFCGVMMFSVDFVCLILSPEPTRLNGGVEGLGTLFCFVSSGCLDCCPHRSSCCSEGESLTVYFGMLVSELSAAAESVNLSAKIDAVASGLSAVAEAVNMSEIIDSIVTELSSAASLVLEWFRGEQLSGKYWHLTQGKVWRFQLSAIFVWGHGAKISRMDN